MPSRRADEPKYREYPCHSPDCQDFVLDNSSPFPDIFVLWLTNVLVLELLLGARIEYRNEHVGDYV
jgi:hypothetical protein